MAKNSTYYEPENYFPKEIRKMYGLGEFNSDTNTGTKKTVKKSATKKKSVKKKTTKK